uniref:Uncharacterized protein n=1 Tax=Branchiostoma floridae TaxID=7739 RepID=C3YDL1_BRAFL|eukprot:XP_002605812.1 hypothetical protein BRAFLDRAFT_84425 [Branchiostoma floridae]
MQVCRTQEVSIMSLHLCKKGWLAHALGRLAAGVYCFTDIGCWPIVLADVRPMTSRADPKTSHCRSISAQQFKDELDKMPYILVRSNFDVPQEFDAKLSKLMSELTKMHEGYILSQVRVNKRMLLGGSADKCVYSDVRLADVLLSNEKDKERYYREIHNFLVGELGVEPARSAHVL